MNISQTNIMIILFIVASFLPLLQCVDYKTAILWTGRGNDGGSTFNIMYGDPYIYLKNFANGNRDPQNSYMSKTFTATSNVFKAIAYDAEKEYIAISDNRNGRLLIYGLSDLLGNSNPTAKYVFEDIRNITGLAFAPNFNLLYFVYSNISSYIGVMDFTRNRWIKFDSDTYDEEPYSIAVDEENRFLFWTGKYGAITRSNLYGEEIIEIGLISTKQKTDLVVDKSSGKLFWLDGNLFSSDFGGNNEHQYYVRDAGLSSTFVINKDIAILCKSIGNECYSYNISLYYNVKSLSSIFFSNTTAIMSASLDSKEFMKTILNPCSSNRCDYMCFPIDLTDYVCRCSSGYTLDSNGWTCTPNGGPLAPTIKNSGVTFNPNGPDSTATIKNSGVTLNPNNGDPEYSDNPIRTSTKNDNNNLDRTSTIKNGGVSLELIGFKWMGFAFLAFKMGNLLG